MKLCLALALFLVPASLVAAPKPPAVGVYKVESPGRVVTEELKIAWEGRFLVAKGVTKYGDTSPSGRRIIYGQVPFKTDIRPKGGDLYVGKGFISAEYTDGTSCQYPIEIEFRLASGSFGKLARVKAHLPTYMAVRAYKCEDLNRFYDWKGDLNLFR